MGGIFESKGLIGKVKEVFDENGIRIDKTQWNSCYLKNIKILNYFYVGMYLIKRCVFQKNINKLASFINRFFWDLLK